MATKKSKPTFIEPTPTEWFRKGVRNEEYSNKYDFTVEGKKFMGEYANGDPCEFTPIIATIEFGRSNSERRANADLISASPDLYRELKGALEIIDRLSEEFSAVAKRHASFTSGEYKKIRKALDKAEGKKQKS